MTALRTDTEHAVGTCGITGATMKSEDSCDKPAPARKTRKKKR
jgi:hypothetical protein